MGPIGVVTNPLARHNRRNPHGAAQLEGLLGPQDLLEQPADRDELAETARRFFEREIAVLCIHGGDGTLHSVLTAMVKASGGAPLPPVAILRAGTMNTIAHGLGVRAAAARMLRFVVERRASGAPLGTDRRWLLDVDGEQYGFLFGNGIIASYLEAYYEGSEPTPTKALYVLARACGSAVVRGAFIRRMLAPFEGTVEVDGDLWSGERWLTVGAGTSDDIGVGFRPFFRCLEHPGRFHAFGCRGMNPMALIRQLPRVYRAQPMQGPEIAERAGSRLVLRSARPITYMVDGDFHRGGCDVVVSVGAPVDFVRG